MAENDVEDTPRPFRGDRRLGESLALPVPLRLRSVTARKPLGEMSSDGAVNCPGIVDEIVGEPRISAPVSRRDRRTGRRLESASRISTRICAALMPAARSRAVALFNISDIARGQRHARAEIAELGRDGKTEAVPRR